MLDSSAKAAIEMLTSGPAQANPVIDKFAYVNQPWTLIDTRMKCSALLKTLVTIASAISTLFLSLSSL